MGPHTALRYAAVPNTWLRHGRSHLAAACLRGTGSMTVLANARKRKTAATRASILRGVPACNN